MNQRDQTDNTGCPSTASDRWRRIVTNTFRLGLTAVAFLYALFRAYQEARQVSPDSLQPASLVAAAICYIGGLLMCGWFWNMSLRDTGGRPNAANLFAAYFAGHMAKYLPGKVWVVIVRTTWPRGAGMNALNLATTATQETLLMMGVGGVGGALLWWLTAPGFRSVLHSGLFLFCLLGGAAMAIAASPLAIGYVLRLRKTGPGPVRLRWRTYFAGVGLMCLCWALLGTSLYFVSGSLATGARVQLLAAVAAVSVGTATGFLTFLPGGLGSRELAITEVLGSYGVPYAALQAAALRLVWLVSEVVCWLGWWIIDASLASRGSSVIPPEIRDDRKRS